MVDRSVRNVVFSFFSFLFLLRLEMCYLFSYVSRKVFHEAGSKGGGGRIWSLTLDGCVIINFLMGWG